VTLGCAAGFQVIAVSRPPVERRVERIGTESRHRSRALQFVSLALVGGAFSLAVAGLMTEAFAHPIERVAAALD
jgi:hypothetical protein